MDLPANLTIPEMRAMLFELVPIVAEFRGLPSGRDSEDKVITETLEHVREVNKNNLKSQQTAEA